MARGMGAAGREEWPDRQQRPAARDGSPSQTSHGGFGRTGRVDEITLVSKIKSNIQLSVATVKMALAPSVVAGDTIEARQSEPEIRVWRFEKRGS